MAIKIFITGTDTNVGKTYISTGIIRACNARGLSTIGIKPISSGSNDDILALREAASIKLPYDKINPITFSQPIAPNIAAEKSNCPLNVAVLNKKIKHALNYKADVCIVEGIGGWNVPLNDHETMADFVNSNNFPVILVVGIKLGCLNHAILTYQSAHQNIVGWIANCIENDMPVCQENIATLKNWLKIPCLGIVGHKQDPAEVIDDNRGSKMLFLH